MKKVNDNLAITLLRGVVAVSGIMATMTIALFTESLNSCVLVLLIGAIAITLVDELINKRKL